MGNKKNKKEIENMKVKHKSINTEEKNKIIKLLIISIILACIVEFIFISSGSNLSVSRCITICGIISFIGLHFVLGFKKLYTLIVDNRFKISGIMIILSTIIGYFQNNFGLQEWILNTNTVLSLWWNIKFYGLLLVSYELFALITNKSMSCSIIGTIVITFSGAVQWNFDKIDSLILGQLVIVLINKILNEENIYKKIMWFLGIIISIATYVLTFEGYAIAFGYIFIALIIWSLIENKEKLKSNNMIFLILSLVIGIICAFILKNSTQIYYNDVIENEVKGLSFLYSYLYNMFLPFNDLGANDLFASFISAFPIPMLIALYYMYKNDDENIKFLLPIVIVAVIETVFCMSGFIDIINKITLFSNVSISRAVAGVNLANVYILFYMLNHIDKKVFSVTSAMRIVIPVMCIIAFIGYPEVFRTTRYMMIFMIEGCLISFLFLIFHDPNYKKTLLFFLCLFTLISGVTVNSIIKF